MDTKLCRWTYEEIWIVLIDTLGVRKPVLLDGDTWYLRILVVGMEVMNLQKLLKEWSNYYQYEIYTI